MNGGGRKKERKGEFDKGLGKGELVKGEDGDKDRKRKGKRRKEDEGNKGEFNC